jgi:hypothetical protein
MKAHPTPSAAQTSATTPKRPKPVYLTNCDPGDENDARPVLTAPK